MKLDWGWGNREWLKVISRLNFKINILKPSWILCEFSSDFDRIDITCYALAHAGPRQREAFIRVFMFFVRIKNRKFSMTAF